MKQLLLSERWRPKELDEIILLPRIRDIFKNGLSQNVILYGNYGTGKTTLARILIGKYSKKSPFLEINSSFYTSIDVLRTKIDDFCSKVYMGFDLDKQIENDSIKYVFLDEFERTSTQYQDALKAYIEEFSTKNVRFIFTTNHINKVTAGIRSRLIEVNFDCQNQEEEKFLKNEIAKKIIKEIAPTEKFEISKEDVIKIINKKFPDFRSILTEIEAFRITGNSLQNTKLINHKIKDELYELLFDRKKSFEEIYHFLNSSFTVENVQELFDLLGKPLIEHCIEMRKLNSENLFKIAFIITDYQKMVDSNLDPMILSLNVLGKLKELFS